MFAKVAPIVSGLLILAAGLVPWLWLAQLNARIRPDLPWAAVATLLYLVPLIAWLDGAGPPRRTSLERRRRLRLWPRAPRPPAEAGDISAAALIGFLGLLSVVWVLIGRTSPVPDLSAYPTTAYRWSMFIMGGVMAGVVEEIAFRGYMQTGIERHDPENAVWITSVVFVASHITHGIRAVVLLGPGFFVASILYGVLARRTGTILPGMVIHILGDLAHVYFGPLRGDASLLFVS